MPKIDPKTQSRRAMSIDDLTTKRGLVKAHPYAKVFPRTASDKLALETNILANGIQVPLVLDPKGRVLDGVTRAESVVNLIKQDALPAGYEVPVVDLIIPKGRNAEEFCVAAIRDFNISRRQLTASQRALMAVKGLVYSKQASDLSIEEAKAELAAGEKPITPDMKGYADKVTATEARILAERYGCSQRMVWHALKVLREQDTELRDRLVSRVDEGALSLAAASDAVRHNIPLSTFEALDEHSHQEDAPPLARNIAAWNRAANAVEGNAPVPTAEAVIHGSVGGNANPGGNNTQRKQKASEVKDAFLQLEASLRVPALILCYGQLDETGIAEFAAWYDSQDEGHEQAEPVAAAG